MKKTSRPLAAAFLLLCAVTLIVLMAFTDKDKTNKKSTTKKSCCTKPVEKACVFRTLIGIEKFDTSKVFVDSKLVEASIKSGLHWLMRAQQTNGGWGAGSHQLQHISDPHAVQADPASTALVGMAILRTTSNPFRGQHANELIKAINYLLEEVENSSPQQVNITNLTNTQPQTKLGRNIDVILTAQFLTNLLEVQEIEPGLKKRVKRSLEKCVVKIQMGQDGDGSWKDGGWAPVLQSALANNALEAAKDAGIKVDEKVLESSRNYQKKNFDVKTNSAVTGKAAGVMLYSISSSSRASAKEARIAVDKIANAKKSGKLKATDQLSEETLVKAGFSRTEAEKYATAYKINQASAARAQDQDVESGFGSNGGEEFLSYLMTGESLIIGGGNDWKIWYDKMSGRLIQIQGQDGSWRGHHCITSPVFCTATCLLILSIHNDLEFLIKVK